MNICLAMVVCNWGLIRRDETRVREEWQWEENLKIKKKEPFYLLLPSHNILQISTCIQVQVEHGAPFSKLRRFIIFRVNNFKKLLLFASLYFAAKDFFFKFKFKNYMFFYLKCRCSFAIYVLFIIIFVLL